MFSIFAGLMILTAILVISTKNPIYSIFALILVFCNAVAILFLWHLEFLAMLLLIVYIGAIAMLFLFVVMMLNIKHIEFYENQMQFLPIGGIIALLFLIELYFLLENLHPMYSDGVKVNFFYWNSPSLPHINVLGSMLYTEYGSFFLIASLVLLLSMVGSLMLTKD
jgi:NADH-quinone oxidoreductase subunit J